jgi:hypothetical protein
MPEWMLRLNQKHMAPCHATKLPSVPCNNSAVAGAVLTNNKRAHHACSAHREPDEKHMHAGDGVIAQLKLPALACVNAVVTAASNRETPKPGMEACSPVTSKAPHQPPIPRNEPP